MMKRKPTFLAGIFGLIFALLLTTPTYAVSTKQANLTIEVPQQVEPDTYFPVKFTITYQGSKTWGECFLGLACPEGLFIKYTYLGKEYRIGEQGTTDNTNEDYYFPYSFDGSLFTKEITINLKAPSYEGRTTISAKLYIDVHRGGDVSLDDTYVSKTIVVKSKPAEQLPENKSSVTYKSPSTTGECNVIIKKFTLDPSQPIANYPFAIGFSIKVHCPSLGVVDKGPFLKVYIRDKSGKQVACYRLGERGFVKCGTFESDYYFSKGTYSKEIWVNNVILDSGIYYIYVEGKMSKYGPDSTIYNPYKLGAFIVKEYTASVYKPTPDNSISEGESSEETYRAVTSKTCSGKPILMVASWADAEKHIKTRTTTGDVIYAYLLFKNPYTMCSYSGTVEINIYKNVDTPLFDLARDELLTTYTESITLGPGEQKAIMVEFSPTDPGTYHYDVLFNDIKYSQKEVRRHYSSARNPTSDELYVKEGITSETVKEKPNEYITVTDYWFMTLDGKKVTEVPEGTKFVACVNLTSPTYTTGRVTLNVKTYAGGPKSLGLFADIAPDTVRDTKTTDVILEANIPTTVCSHTLTARHEATWHNEMYYIEVLFDNKKLGIFPESKDGLVVIPKNGKWNPFVKGQNEMNSIAVLAHGWYTADGTPVSNVVPPGVYVVKATIQNAGTMLYNGTISVVLKQDLDFQFDSTVGTCARAVNIEPGQSQEISCSFTLEDGKAYHYEIWADDRKILDRGPTLKARSAWNLGAYMSDMYNDVLKGTVLNPGNIVGVLVISILGIFLLTIISYVAGIWAKGFLSVYEVWEKVRRK